MKKNLTIIFLTVFLYLLGFGIIIPIIPNLGKTFGASPVQIGFLMSIYSIMQFLCAPLWGRLSDRIGRRPVLVYCLLGEGLAYLLFAFSRSLEVLFIARGLAGIFAASLSTATAYISDISSPQNRTKNMGLIGAAFGLGFVFGPAIGGGLAKWG
ncbi:MAG TPA: MFS transporter, partial [Pseudobdellovibrionaceae bacterium]|nr:MFS transporter [Pseudobdellovibrionaceae bacterium]